MRELLAQRTRWNLILFFSSPEFVSKHLSTAAPAAVLPWPECKESTVR